MMIKGAILKNSFCDQSSGATAVALSHSFAWTRFPPQVSLQKSQFHIQFPTYDDLGLPTKLKVSSISVLMLSRSSVLGPGGPSSTCGTPGTSWTPPSLFPISCCSRLRSPSSNWISGCSSWPMMLWTWMPSSWHWVEDGSTGACRNPGTSPSPRRRSSLTDLSWCVGISCVAASVYPASCPAPIDSVIRDWPVDLVVGSSVVETGSRWTFLTGTLDSLRTSKTSFRGCSLPSGSSTTHMVDGVGTLAVSPCVRCPRPSGSSWRWFPLMNSMGSVVLRIPDSSVASSLKGLDSPTGNCRSSPILPHSLRPSRIGCPSIDGLAAGSPRLWPASTTVVAIPMPLPSRRASCPPIWPMRLPPSSMPTGSAVHACWHWLPPSWLSGFGQTGDSRFSPISGSEPLARISAVLYISNSSRVLINPFWTS